MQLDEEISVCLMENAYLEPVSKSTTTEVRVDVRRAVRVKPTSERFCRGTNRNSAVPDLIVVIRQRVTSTMLSHSFCSGWVRHPSVLLKI